MPDSTSAQSKPSLAINQTLRQALDEQPDNAALHFELGYAAVQAEAYAEAEQWLASGLRLAPDSLQGLRLAALIAHGRKEWKSAETHARSWIRAEPDSSAAHYLLADSLQQQGWRSLEAQEQFAKAAELDGSADAATVLHQFEQRNAKLVEGIFIFCVVSGVAIALLGLYLVRIENSLAYLWMTLLGGLAAGYLGWAVWQNRRAVSLERAGIRIGNRGETKEIPYSDIREVRSTQAGIVLDTATGRERIVRVNQHEQNDLHVKLSRRVEESTDRPAARYGQTEPFTVSGNWWFRLMQFFLLGCALLPGYAFFVYGTPNATMKDWLTNILIVSMLGFVGSLAVWWIAASPLYMRFSAETITIRYPLKVRRYLVSDLRYAGLRRGYRVFRGRQMPNFTIDLHFADGEIVKLDQDEIQHPPSDLLPLHHLAERLQAYYKVTAPPADTVEIGRYVV